MKGNSMHCQGNVLVSAAFAYRLSKMAKE